MVFVSIAKTDFRYGQGEEISKDTFQTWPGVRLFFYDEDSISEKFGDYGLIDAHITNEPKIDSNNHPSQRFWYIVCRKETNKNTSVQNEK